MTLSGNITQLLKEKAQREGWTMTEDEDFVYLNYKSQKNLAVFSAVGLQMSKVVSFIDGYTGKEASLGYHTR